MDLLVGIAGELVLRTVPLQVYRGRDNLVRGRLKVGLAQVNPEWSPPLGGPM